MKFIKIIQRLLLFLALLNFSFIISCTKKSSSSTDQSQAIMDPNKIDTSTPTPTPTPIVTPAPTPTDTPLPIKSLYVSSGACYSGNGVTSFTSTTSSNLVYKVNSSTGMRSSEVIDYNSNVGNSGDSPAGLLDWNESQILVLVENATSGRRVELVNKDTGVTSVFTQNSTALNAQLRRIVKTSDGGFLVSKSAAIEKFSPSKTRITSGSNPYISAPGGTCGTSATLLTAISVLNNGNIVFAHANTTPNNKIGIIGAGGYSVVGDCKSALAAPSTTTYPTAMVYVKSFHQLIVSYAGSTTATDINSIYVYDIDETNNTIGVGTKIYDSSQYPSVYPYLLFGISSLEYDQDNNHLYVATAISSATTVVNYDIEKLHYDPITKTLTNLSTIPFYNYGIDTKCISSMVLGL